jgi:Cd2+/Zn2+-exporting ATPase
MAEKTQIEIALMLPTVPDARDACVQRLADLLKAKAGIEAAHVADTKGAGQDQICIHYDPDRLSIGEVRDLAKRAGAELDQQFGHLLLRSECGKSLE